MEFTSLMQLACAMRRNDSAVVDAHGQWRTDLPTFGGSEPTDTTGVWSWDESHILVGTCAADLTVEVRS